MTIRDSLILEVGSKALVDKILIRQGLTGSNELTQDNYNEVEVAKAYCYRALVAQPDWSEDGLAVSYSRQYMIDEANRIFRENELTDNVRSFSPTINNGTSRW